MYVAAIDVGNSVENGLSRVFEYIPQLIGALLLLIVGYFIAVILKRIVQAALHRIRFDRAMHTSLAGKYISRVIEYPTRFVGKVVFWLVFLGFISMAVTALNLPVLNNIVTAIYAYIPRIIAAVIIFLVASAIVAGSEAFIRRVMGRTMTAKILAALVPAVTMSIAVFMILNELNIAKDIVNITYVALTGSLALGLALAFGLGGRDVARTILEQAYNASLENVDQVKSDMRTAQQNTRREAGRVRRAAEES